MFKERDSVRSRSFLKATIRFQNRNVTMDCIVRNTSLSGARLEISPELTLPAEFELEIPQRQATFHCALKWRRANAAGVKFNDIGLPAMTAPAQSSAIIEELQRENAGLRQEIAQLRARHEELEDATASIPANS
jgi:hypothetical protein